MFRKFDPEFLNFKTYIPKKSLTALYEMELLVSDMNETIILPGEFYDLSALNLSYQLNISSFQLGINAYLEILLQRSVRCGSQDNWIEMFTM